MRIQQSSLFIGMLLMLLLASVAGAQVSAPVQAVVREPADALKYPSALITAYTETLRDGVPTPTLVDAAFRDAEKANTLDSWTSAARLANTYAHVVDILCDHYTKMYQVSLLDGGSGNLTLLTVAVNYEGKRDDYRAARNLAYLKLSRLHLANGQKAEALSYALAAVELSSTELNQEGEALIRQIIEYKQ